VWFLSFIIAPSKLVWESHEAKLTFPARSVLKNGTKTVVISEGIQEDYLKFGISQTNLMVAHDGIDESFFAQLQTKLEVRNRLSLSSDEKIVMYIGGFDSWKGVETYFAAAGLVDEVRFVAIGGSSEQVAAFSKKYPLVQFLGQLPYADLKNNQQAADILVIPNSGKIELSSRYTSPLKLFAHMASGVPIVASDIPSLVSVTGRDLVTLFPSDSAEALAREIRNVLEDYDNKVQRAQELKEISLGYTWTQRAKNILSFNSAQK
jgi:glycosyltransferase involved in cell wall biosynthesis